MWRLQPDSGTFVENFPMEADEDEEQGRIESQSSDPDSSQSDNSAHHAGRDDVSDTGMHICHYTVVSHLDLFLTTKHERIGGFCDCAPLCFLLYFQWTGQHARQADSRSQLDRSLSVTATIHNT